MNENWALSFYVLPSEVNNWLNIGIFTARATKTFSWTFRYSNQTMDHGQLNQASSMSTSQKGEITIYCVRCGWRPIVLGLSVISEYRSIRQTFDRQARVDKQPRRYESGRGWSRRTDDGARIETAHRSSSYQQRSSSVVFDQSITNASYSIRKSHRITCRTALRGAASHPTARNRTAGYQVRGVVMHNTPYDKRLDITSLWDEHPGRSWDRYTLLYTVKRCTEP